jgi:RNA polymerase-associated protein
MKDVDAHVIHQLPGEPPHDDLLALNPFGTLPTLVDRDLTLFDADIIGEYLDERYPFPPLWPTEPASRARARLILRCWVGNWYDLYEKANEGDAKAAKQLNEELLAHGDGFAVAPWFMHEEATMVDCALLPLLAKLRSENKLPGHAAIRRYCDRHLSSGIIARCLKASEANEVS